MNVTFTGELVSTLYTNQVFVLVGIVLALILYRKKICKLPLWAGFIGQLIPGIQDYLAFGRSTMAYTMQPVIISILLKSLVCFIVGAIVLKIVRSRYLKKEQAKKNVVFFCPICGNTHEGIPGEIQGCPNCHKRVDEKETLWMDWKQMSEEEQNALKAQWKA